MFIAFRFKSLFSFTCIFLHFVSLYSLLFLSSNLFSFERLQPLLYVARKDSSFGSNRDIVIGCPYRQDIPNFPSQ